MSGGSYNYLCHKFDTQDLLNATEELRQMSDRLAGLGYAQDAAQETEQLLLTLRQVQNRVSAIQQRLAPVWRAIEWWDSCDSGEDGVKAALARYRGETT